MLATCAGIPIYYFFLFNIFYFPCHDVLLFGPPDKCVVKQEICLSSQGLKSQLLVFFLAGRVSSFPL